MWADPFNMIVEDEGQAAFDADTKGTTKEENMRVTVERRLRQADSFWRQIVPHVTLEYETGPGELYMSMTYDEAHVRELTSKMPTDLSLISSKCNNCQREVSHDIALMCGQCNSNRIYCGQQCGDIDAKHTCIY